MTSQLPFTDLHTAKDGAPFIALTPFERPDVALVQRVIGLQVPAVLDLGRDTQRWPDLLAALPAMPPAASAGRLGLRIPDHAVVDPALVLPACVAFLVVAEHVTLPPAWQALPVLAQVTSVAAARDALRRPVAGLIAKGQEAGGLTGDESSFVLLQRVVALAGEQGTPVWCQGGMALHTAVAAFAAGAAGVVLDAALAGLPECSLPTALKQRVLALDGSELRCLAGGYQVLVPDHRDLPALDALSADQVLARLQADTDPLLAIGQDAALASLVLAQCSTVDAFFNALRTAIDGQLHQARGLQVLAEGSPWAAAHGVRYPIAQGPMTRVSDTAEFAAAVATAGALPFTALSLLNEASSRTLLEATRDQLAGRPWGVGVLGFADPAILEPQLALVRELRPSALILAGGRPSQARPFVDLGIPTYLHVPSPGLLSLFLKDGATHFIFEGRECGGHVGPRYSFVLWEQAIACLLAHDRPEALHVLFAGGIHDARSAAMVAAIAAPLAARGVKVGVLMGTAYIATEEAVQSGAVLAEFQRQALSGEATTLVETAPGHAIRCIPSGFVDLFAREKQRLRQDGVDTKVAWQTLEQLTVGRLRIASKGVDRVDGRLVSVPLPTQQAEGMYMIGQVVAMTRDTLTMAALHASVSHGACAWLDALTVPTLHRGAGQEAVAIVGMACLYAGSPDLETYWQNILTGRDLVTEVPAERWSVAQYYRGADAPGDKSVSKWGAFISPTPFDPLKYGIPPASLAAIEPVQLLSLEVTQAALADAGYAERWFDREKTSVIFGAEAGMDLGNQYTFRNLWQQYAGELPPALAEALPTLTEDSFPGMLVNVISGRIANRLGLGGVNYAVTSACASSLTAIELGVKELRAGTSNLVLAGGADFHNGISDFLMFSSVGALSPTGRCRSFDNQADGIALGEGVGVVVLKRLSEALRDGDRIYAVIDGIAGSSDGKGLGLTAPRKEGQKRALERAYWQAGVQPADIGLVEAHGTGTVVGDRTELQTLTDVFIAGGALPGQAALGSVKSQIGHSKCAAGVAGLIKVAKALHHGVQPGTQQISAPNAWYRADTSPFMLNAEARPWLDTAGGPARGAVSAFGFGGANFHAVLSAWPAHRSDFGAAALPNELFLLRAERDADIPALARQLLDYLTAAAGPVALRDLALTSWRLAQGPVRAAFVADGLATLVQRLQALVAGAPEAAIARRADTPAGPLAVVFSGQGSQHPGMLRDLFVYFPALRDVLAAGTDLLSVMYPGTAYTAEEKAHQREALTDTRCAQPALGLVEWAAFRWLRGFGLKPDMAAGHSYGELVALATAGAFDLPALIGLSRARAEAMMSVVGDDAGRMAAVSLDAASLAPHLADTPDVVMANQNSPTQTVISGPAAAVETAMARLKAAGIGCKAIATACAFHSPLMRPASERFARDLAAVEIASPRWPVYANLDAAPHQAATLRSHLASHVASPVRFVDEITRMHDDGARVFLEIGPKQVLTGLVSRILDGRPHVALALDADGSLQGLLTTLARLAVLLPDFDAEALFAGRARVLDLSAPPQLSASTWMVDGGRAWPLKTRLPAHAGQVVTAPVVQVGGPAIASAGIAAGDQALADYLGNMRELVNAQRDVLLGYFGAPAAPRETRLAASPSGMPAPTVPAPWPAAATPSASVAAPAAPATASHHDILLALVSERTGYPAEMLDLDLDLEADLSIDSIKRLEVIGELSQRLSLRQRLGSGADALIEQLSGRKTLRAVLDWLAERLPASAPAGVPAEPPAGVPPAAQRPLAEVLLDIVSDCTGYPVEALDLNLDLEADLSIDSIKRLEVVGRLAEHVNLGDRGAARDALLDSLAACKTLAAMLVWLKPHQAGSDIPLSAAADASMTHDIPFARYVLRGRDIAVPTPAMALAGRQVLLVEDTLGVADRLAAQLADAGAVVTRAAFSAALSAHPALHHCDTVVCAHGLDPASRVDDVKPLFAALRIAVLARASTVLLVTAQGGDFARSGADPHRGGGLAGLAKSLDREFPHLAARRVDVDAEEPADTLAGYLLQELQAGDALAEVAWHKGVRRQRDVLPAALDTAALLPLPLTTESVVLLTGGARGITALVAIELARRHRCHLELVGRSAWPVGEESAATQGITDPRLLRQALHAEDTARRPADIERLARRLLADRECRATLAAVREAGGSVHYTALDVRDGQAFSDLIADIYARRGRIDGVIHGAGVVEDKLVRDKTDDSFARVFDTKVNSALVLRQHIRDDVAFVAFFSSVASAFGNRGQVDYASANDVLDTLARSWQAHIAGRVLSVNWGPWADTGMVNDALRQEYARKGIGLVPQREGVNALLQELANPEAETQVVLMAGLPERFAATAEPAGA